MAESVWKKEKIAMTRRAKWHPDLKDFFVQNLLDKKTNESLKSLQEWAYAKAWDWNINHRRRGPKIKATIKNGQIELPKGQRLLA